LVKRNCSSSGNVKDLEYWRNDLFAGIVIYLLPLCLIALLPGLYWSFISGLYVVIAVDVLVVTGILIIAFAPFITIAGRKIIFAGCMYTLSYVLEYYIGMPGPGMLYMLVAAIFCILIFPSAYAFWPAWLNFLICILYAVLIGLHIISWPVTHNNLLGEWIAVSSNLVFLGFLCATLIPRLFNGLQETINKEMQFKEALNEKQQSLQDALDMLQKKNKELEQFAYITSHDLKEPLRMVTSFIGLLKHKYGEQLDEKAHTYIDFALDGGNRMHRMIADLLQLSGTASHDEIEEMVSLSDILKDVKQNIFKLIEDNNAEIIIKTGLPTLAIHRADITSLLQNLLSNAIKFRKKDMKPVIEISATEKQSVWLFSIEDNGIGVEKEKFEKIFEIFARLHSQETYEGTGIGLAICKKIVERNGGEIWLKSQEGKGSTFYFTIKK
jgi:signal transduction histidine kinase